MGILFYISDKTGADIPLQDISSSSITTTSEQASQDLEAAEKLKQHGFVVDQAQTTKALIKPSKIV